MCNNQEWLFKNIYFWHLPLLDSDSGDGQKAGREKGHGLDSNAGFLARPPAHTLSLLIDTICNLTLQYMHWIISTVLPCSVDSSIGCRGHVCKAWRVDPDHLSQWWHWSALSPCPPPSSLHWSLELFLAGGPLCYLFLHIGPTLNYFKKHEWDLAVQRARGSESAHWRHQSSPPDSFSKGEGMCGF